MVAVGGCGRFSGARGVLAYHRFPGSCCVPWGAVQPILSYRRGMLCHPQGTITFRQRTFFPDLFCKHGAERGTLSELRRSCRILCICSPLKPGWILSRGFFGGWCFGTIWMQMVLATLKPQKELLNPREKVFHLHRVMETWVVQAKGLRKAEWSALELWEEVWFPSN